MLPPPPGRFSMTNGWPSDGARTVYEISMQVRDRRNELLPFASGEHSELASIKAMACCDARLRFRHDLIGSDLNLAWSAWHVWFTPHKQRLALMLPQPVRQKTSQFDRNASISEMNTCHAGSSGSGT